MNRTTCKAATRNQSFTRWANDEQTRAILGQSDEAAMEITLRLPVDEWLTLIKGSRKNGITVAEAIAFLIRTGQDSCDWEQQGFQM